MPIWAKCKQPSESHSRDCKHCFLLVLWCSKAPRRGWVEPLGGESIHCRMVHTFFGLHTHPSLHYCCGTAFLKDTLSFTTGQRGPSPGRDLLGRYFICHPIPSGWLSSVKRHCGINPWRSDSVQMFGWLWSGAALQILGISKHKIMYLILLFGVHSWKQDLKCQKNQDKNREQKYVTHLRY